MTTIPSAVSALAALLAATSVSGQEAVPTRSPLLNAVLACRAIATETDRLACFDQATAAFEMAEREGEVAVIDRAQADQTRRRLFGLNLDGAALFGNLREGQAVSAIETSLTRARQGGRGAWTFELADGSVWRQVDDEPVNARPTPGDAVRVRQAALGSYLLSVDGERSVRVRRER